jgi:putative transposase
LRNGTSGKTLKRNLEDLPIEVPRDRKGEFEPQIIKKVQRRFNGFDDKILSMYARSMTTRDIREGRRVLISKKKTISIKI